MFEKFKIELVVLAVKSSRVGGDRDVFVLIFSADCFGFAAAIQAKLEQKIQFVKVAFCLN